MPQELLKLIQDTESKFWLIGYNPEATSTEAYQFGNEGDALQFANDEARQVVLDNLNSGYTTARYIGGDRPPLPPKNP